MEKIIREKFILNIQRFGKQLLLIILSAGIVCFLLTFVYFTLFNIKKSTTAKSQFSTSPNQLFENTNSARTADHYPPNEYFPSSLDPESYDTVDIDVSSYAVMDRDRGILLFAKNATTRLPIASLTKIMTSIVSLEHMSSDAFITISPYAVKVGEASMGLSIGERLTVGELLYGMILPSGNDAAEALAEGVGIQDMVNHGLDPDRVKGRSWFIAEMNRKAQGLGMLDTYFFNPTGLDEDTKDKSSYSTALDLLGFVNYALNNPVFAKMVDTRTFIIPYKEGYHKAFYLENILQLSDSFKGIKGVKPGSSIFAKETLVSYAQRDGRKIIVVILGSNHTKDDVVKIYKKIFG